MSSDVLAGVLAILAACGIGVCAIHQARTPTPNDLRAYIEAALEVQAAGTEVPFAVISRVFF